MNNKEKDKEKQDETEKPSNDLVFCYEAIITFNEIIEKLDYIGKYTSSHSAGVMSKSIGLQIENLMKKQQDLEKEFEGLIKKKTGKTALLEEEEIKRLSVEIEKKADMLRNSTNNICKSLAENPDIPKNLRKALLNKESFKEKFIMIRNKLIEGSFEMFKGIVENIKKNDINISEKRSVEMNLFFQVRKINENLTVEENEFNQDKKKLNHRLAIEKKELAKAKMEEKLLSDYRKADLEALKELKLFDFDQEKENFRQKIKEKEREKQNETKIYSQIYEYLQQQKAKVAQEKEEWIVKKGERDMKNKELDKKIENNLKSKADKIQNITEISKSLKKRLEEIKTEDSL